MTLFALLMTLPADAGETVHEHMAEHLSLTMAARDAVVRGDFNGARKQLKTLGKHAPLEGMPEASQLYIDALQAAAKAGSKAKTIEAVGASISQVALQCGGCHEALGRGPDFGAFASPAEGEELSSHMQRHAWASARMWEGLVAPSKERWDAGALHLLEDPWVKGEGAHVDPDIKRFAESIHSTGTKALLTWSETERAGLYGNLIATCARCHNAIDDGSAKPE